MASVREMAPPPSSPSSAGPASHQAMLAMLKAGVPPPQAANLMTHAYQMAEKWWGVGLLSPGAQDNSQHSSESSIGAGKHLFQLLFDLPLLRLLTTKGCYLKGMKLQDPNQVTLTS